MDIWITKCRRTVTCSHCNKEISLHQPMIVGKLWTNFTPDSATPTYRAKLYHWHVERKEDQICCWIEQGMNSLETRKIVETRGRRIVVLDPEKKSQRLKLLQKHARLIQQMKEEMEKLASDGVTPRPQGNWLRIARIGSKLEKLKAEIEPLGGVPSSWLDKIEPVNQEPEWEEDESEWRKIANSLKS